MLPVLAARLRRRPVLVKTTLSGADGAPAPGLHLRGRAVAAVYRRCDAIVALSDDLAESFVRDGRFRARILRIPNGVDCELFRPGGPGAQLAARRRFGLDEDALVVISVGRLEARKNVVALVEAVGKLSWRPVCLLLAGPQSPVAADRADLARAIAALPAGAEARCTGRIDAGELAQLLCAADVFALASRAEGLPNSLLEGMASGLPCVATDIPGSRDVLSGGGGLLVELDDCDALVEALDRLAADPEQRARLGREGRQLAELEYSLPSVAQRYLEVYASLLAPKEAVAALP